MGYHRLLTHRGYKAPKWLEYVMAVCATLSLEGGPLVWVATHRVHHQLTDRPGDPHTPREGGWWSHAGWVIYGAGADREPAVARQVRTRPREGPFLPLAESIPLGSARGARLPARHRRMAVGAMGYFSSRHAGTARHLAGEFRDPYVGLQALCTRDDSRNNWWVALLTGGEGWHNNHHAHPVSARHGLTWYEFDLNYYGIWLLGKLGLAKNIHAAKPTQPGSTQPPKPLPPRLERLSCQGNRSLPKSWLTACAASSSGLSVPRDMQAPRSPQTPPPAAPATSRRMSPDRVGFTP